MTSTLKRAVGLAVFYMLFLVPLALYCAVYVHSPEFLKDVFASEDGIVEWLTFFCFLAAATTVKAQSVAIVGPRIPKWVGYVGHT